MPTSPLPNDPSFEHLRKEAKRLRNAARAGDAQVLTEVKEYHPRASELDAARITLADAQLVLARAYGFASWAKLKRHLGAIEPFVWNPPPLPSDPTALVDIFIRLACLDYGSWHRSNPEKVRRVLDQHPQIVRTHIYSAAAAGDVAAVREMLENVPSLINVKGGPLKWEPLLYACYSRLDATDKDHSTLEVARLLLANGADPNAGFLWGANYLFTALTGAFGRGEDWNNQPPHPDCDALAMLLLEAGADPNDGQALYNRHFQEDDGHLKLLFGYGLGQEKPSPWRMRIGDRIAAPSRELVQQLCWAVTHNFPARVRLLVEHGVDVNMPSLRNGRTPYEEALRTGNQSIAEYLLQHGAKKTELDATETFALACIADQRDEVQARLAADPNLLDKLGHAGRIELLHRAVESKRHNSVRLVVELGVDINGMVTGTGWDRTVLHNAAAWGGLDMVKLLLELGADPHLRDQTHHAAPIGWAAYGQQQEVVDYLLSFANIFDAMQCDGLDRVAELLRADPALASARDEEGHPVMFYLNPQGAHLEEMIALLTAHGGNLDARDNESKTLLDRVLVGGHSEFASVLRRYGATTSSNTA
jgi:ankyrin repeat protein